MTSENANLYLGLTAADMAQIDSEGTKDYYATVDSSKNTSPVESNYNPAQQYYTVSQVKLTEGDENVKYKCTAKFNIAVTGLDDEKTQLQSDDGLLELKTQTSSGVTALISESADGSSGVTSTSQNLNSLANLESGKDYYITYEFTRSSTVAGDTADLQAAFKITNTEKEQNYLAGKTINITIKTADDGNLKCEIAKETD